MRWLLGVACGDRPGWLHEAEPAVRHGDGDRIGRFRDDHGAAPAQPPDATVPEHENHPEFGYRDMIPCPCSHNQRLFAQRDRQSPRISAPHEFPHAKNDLISRISEDARNAGNKK